MKKIVSLLLALTMVIGMMSFASADNVTNLVTISLGSKPVGYDDVIKAANEYTAEKYGLTLEVRFLDWDPSRVYPIIMNTGDGVDLVFYSGWPGSQDWARKGGFVELDDLLDNYPELKAAIPSEAWEQVKIDGHIYCVPAPETSWTANTGIIYRKDLCTKYNLPVPDSTENLIAYLEGVKANNPDMYPLASHMDSYALRFDTLVWPTASGSANGYGLEAIGSVDNLTKYYGSEAHLAELKLMREFVEKGYVSPDLMGDTVEAFTKFDNGLCAILLDSHTDSYGGRVQALETAKETDPSKADWEIGFIPFNVAQGYVRIPSYYDNNATGIAYKNSEHIDEALTYLQAVMTDAKLHHILRYGVEGVHYELDENGYYKNLSADFTACGLSLWNWRADALNLEGSNDPASAAKEEVFEIYRTCKTMATTFTFNKENVEDECANFNAVCDEYLKPLQYGLVEDVEAGLNEFMKQAKIAGLEDIWDEYIKQYNAWLAQQ